MGIIDNYQGTKKGIKEMKRDAKRIFSFKGGPFILLIIGFILGFFVCIQFFNGPLIGIDPKATVDEKTDTDEEKAEPRELQPCMEIKFKDNLNDWKIEHYDKPDKSGFYCPRGYSFRSPDIWNEKHIPILFDLIEIKYRSKNKNDKIDNPAAFIFSIGEDPRILRFYITEIDSQVIGFEKIIIDAQDQRLDREPGKILEDPIQHGTEVILRIESAKGAGNEVTFHFNLEYISAITKSPLGDSFSYSVVLPSPDIERSEAKVGFGTLKGDCIQPISYKICY